MQWTRVSTAVVAGLVLSGCSLDRPTATVTEPEAMQVSPSLSQFATQSTPTGVLLVSYTEGAEAAARASVTAGGGRILRQLPEIGLLYVTGMDAPSATSLAGAAGIAAVAADQLARMIPSNEEPLGAAVEANGPRVSGSDQHSAYLYEDQWNIRWARADVAWVPSAGGVGELVCVLDTGIDPGHLDLNGRIDHALTGILVPRFASDATPIDFNKHGSAVAAIVTSNGIGVASTAPDARLCSIKVLSEDGQGTTGDLVAGIVQAATLKADVINLSLGQALDLADANSRALYNQIAAAVAYAHSMGTVLVAAAGNDRQNFEVLSPPPYQYVHVPSMISGVIGVGATWFKTDELWYWSNRGSAETMDLLAPGVYIPSVCTHYISLCPTPNWYLLGYVGTSFAAPMVSGAAAVVESTVRRQYAEKIQMTPGAIALCLRKTADKVGNRSTYGAGRLNVLRAALGCSRYG